jgi:hypothetical protein
MLDQELIDLLFTAEDRLELAAAQEIVRRDSLAPYLSQIVMEKHHWLAELPAWWAVVHSSYLLGAQGGEAVVMPMLAALRWSDAFDCDWVSEVLPSIFGRLGPAAIPGLTAVANDFTAGWSARDVAFKGLAAISLNHEESTEHVFRVIGQRFMDEGEDRAVRQLAGQVLLDFRRGDYRLALLKFAREEWFVAEMEGWYQPGLDPDDVEAVFRRPDPEPYHYQEDWMRFYQPSEVQRRQKRWMRERLTTSRVARERLAPGAGGGRVLPLHGNRPDPEPPVAPDPSPSK